MIPYINIHTHSGTVAPDTIAVNSYRLGSNASYPPALFSAGIHPWNVTCIGDIGGCLAELEKLDIAAVGEIGLDHLHPDLPLQHEVFARQLAIASLRRLPVIIHNVRAFEEVMKTLSSYDLPGVVFHGYTGSAEQTQKLTESGYCMSLGEVSLKSSRTIGALKSIPLTNIFLETDDSDISIGEIYRQAAVAFNIPMAELKTQLYDNYKRLFTK